MAEHLMQTQLQRYRERKLSAAELQKIDEHISECAACRELLNSYLGDLAERRAALVDYWPEMLARLGAKQEHLSYDEIADLVDGELQNGVLRQVQAHLNACAECAERVQDLTAFREEVQAERLVEERETAPTFWQRFREFQLPRLTPVQLVPIAAAAAVVISVAVWLSWSSMRSSSAVVALKDGGGRVVLDKDGHIVAPKALPNSYEQL
ncbi:MAG TPA: zf-HC2 domain-containing protein, partial [Chthoniobacterales bacterium]|nr:zf-HC2 domain-containing protein [Chthoniobacterales bacterium]